MDNSTVAFWNLWLVVAQTGAAIVAACAAIAMWKATVNLVRITQGSIFVNVVPKLSLGLVNPQPFETPAQSVLLLRNDSFVDASIVTIDVGPCFRSDNDAISKTTETIHLKTLRSGKNYKITLWHFAKLAVTLQDRLPDSFKTAREADFVPIDVFIQFRHGITGAEHSMGTLYLVEFGKDGSLYVAETSRKNSLPLPV